MSPRLFFSLFIGENCSKLILKCFWTAEFTQMESELTFSIIQQYLFSWQVRAVLIKLHPLFFLLTGIQYGEEQCSADPAGTKEGVVVRESQTVQEFSFPSGKSYTRLNELGVPDLSGTCGKGTKECWQRDVQIGKTVNLALDTQETQGFLHN